MTATTEAVDVKERMEAKSGLQILISDWRHMTRRNVLRLFRTPEKLLLNIIMTVMFVLLFRYVFGGAIAVPDTTYVNFLIPGIIVQSAVFISASTSIGLAEDINRGIIDRFRAMPISRSAVLAGRVITDSVENTVMIMATAVVGFIVGWRIDTSLLHFLGLIGMAFLIGMAMTSVGAYTGMLLKKPELVQSFGMLWMFPATFISGVFIPPETMPNGLRQFAENNPVTIWAETLRNLSIGGRGPLAEDILTSVIWIIGIVVVFGMMAVRAYKKIT